MTTERAVEVLQAIADDMEADVKHFDGKPFTGRTVAEIHGNLAAAIKAIALALKQHVEVPHGR